MEVQVAIIQVLVQVAVQVTSYVPVHLRVPVPLQVAVTVQVAEQVEVHVAAPVEVLVPVQVPIQLPTYNQSTKPQQKIIAERPAKIKSESVSSHNQTGDNAGTTSSYVPVQVQGFLALLCRVSCFVLRFS